MNDTEREHIENQILLRSTGELSQEENEALDAVLARDAEAADFARFLAANLRVSAPRDFAAGAIALALPRIAVQKRRALTPAWVFAAAAAVIILIGVVSMYDPATSGSVPARRLTSALSDRLSDIEAEIALTRASYSRSRFNRSSALQ